MSGQPLLEALHQAIAFQPLGERVANVSVGRGTLDGKPVRAAIVENRVASGSLGRAEADKLVALFTIATREKCPVVLFLDSAGARVSEGLGALGAFRKLYRAALEVALSGAPIAAVLGRNCFGGSSMLAHVAPRRLFGPGTRLAMSGPAILATAAGADVLDDAFRAMTDATISGEARAKASPANTTWVPGGDLAAWLREALGAHAEADAPAGRHAVLGKRLPATAAKVAWESVHRRELEKIYGGGYEAREADGVLQGAGRRSEGGEQEAFVGLVGRQPVGAARAWRFADLVWAHAAKPPARLEVFLDCATHAARLDDERIVLSEYITGMSLALGSLARRGTEVGLTVTGQAGGGVYVALAAPAKRIASVHGADIQVLPGAAVAAILGESRETTPGFDDYRTTGVADEELKLGFVP